MYWFSVISIVDFQIYKFYIKRGAKWHCKTLFEVSYEIFSTCLFRTLKIKRSLSRRETKIILLSCSFCGNTWFNIIVPQEIIVQNTRVLHKNWKRQLQFVVAFIKNSFLNIHWVMMEFPFTLEKIITQGFLQRNAR